MIDIIKKTMLAGLGLAFLTKDKVEELAKDFVEKAKLSENEAKEFIRELQKKSEDARKDVGDQIEKTVRDTLKKMNIATRDDLESLEKRLRQAAAAKKQKGAKS